MDRRIRHGHSRENGQRTPTYNSWANMVKRCTNPKQKRFKHYGGRGISVCERWRSFVNFLADMGERPSLKHSIDRFPNPSGNYEPGNCRWATPQQQHETQRHHGGVLRFSDADVAQIKILYPTKNRRSHTARQMIASLCARFNISRVYAYRLATGQRRTHAQ